MPRPTDITPEQLAQWTADHDEYVKNDPDDLALRPSQPEVWCGGCYLKMKLLEMGCPENRAERICFAVGQRQSMPLDDDPWTPVFKAVEDYKHGKWEEPGEELGAKIFLEKFGPNPNPKKVIKWLQAAGINSGKMKALMFRMMVEGKDAVLMSPPPE